MIRGDYAHIIQNQLLYNKGKASPECGWYSQFEVYVL